METSPRRPAYGSPRSAVVAGGAAGTVVAALVLLGTLGLGPAGGVLAGDAAALQVVADHTPAGAPVAPGHGQEQFLTLSNAGKTSLDDVQLAVRVDGDERLRGPQGLVVDVAVCEAVRAPGGEHGCTQPVPLVEGMPLERLELPVAIPDLRLGAGEETRLRVTLTLPHDSAAVQGARAQVSYRFAAS